MEIMQVNITFIVPICTCSIHAVGPCAHLCAPIFNLLGILPPQAMAQAKAKPKLAMFDSSGLAYRFRKPEPSKARPKPWLSGQAGPEHHYPSYASDPINIAFLKCSRI